MSRSSGVTPLNLPLPAGLPPTIMVDQRDPADDAAISNVKFSRKADLHIFAKVNQLSNAAFCANAMVMDRGPRIVPTPAECALIFSGKQDAFHDGRENVGVDVFNIDVLQLENWIQAKSAAKPIDIIYITFDTTLVTKGAPYTLARSLTDYPAVRLVNAAQLRYPLTIATDRPVYVQGNFNTVGWQPSSILGDAITFLSPAWTDATHAWNAAWTGDPSIAHAFVVTNATPMSVYGAIAAGHSSSPCDVNRLLPTCNPADSAAFYGTPADGWLVSELRRRAGELPPLPRGLGRQRDAVSRLAGLAVRQPVRHAQALVAGVRPTTTARRSATGRST